MSQSSSDKPDVLIVTVTDVEYHAVIDAFGTGKDNKFRIKTLNDLAYFDLGMVGDIRVWMVRTRMGSDGTGGSLMTIQKGIKEVKPKAIIMVGIAFGIKHKGFEIGDVLISEKITSYEMQKIGTAGIIPRGDRMPATAYLVQKFESIAQEWSVTEEGAPVHCGLILSGNKLIDNYDFLSQLLAQEPESIGGEMEGAGLFTTAHDNLVDWILVKAICDWADGNKDQDTESRQVLAAKNAAQLTRYVLMKKNILRGRRNSIKGARKNPKTEVVQEVTFNKEFLEESRNEIRQWLNCTNYKFAVETGKKIAQKIGEQLEHDDPEIELLLSEIRVYYALAKIYSEGFSERPGGSSTWLRRVITHLEKRKLIYLNQDKSTQQDFHLILERAYNHLGYSYWVDRGHYEAALGKFNMALEHFIEGGWKQEMATVYDNLARVYAQIGFRSHAEFLCNHGLKLREEYLKYKNDKENQYRHALSLNSSAIIHLTYGQCLRAYLESERALEIFEQCVKEKGERGVGLALITRGRASRMLGSHWRFTNGTISSEEHLQKALTDFKRAEEIFKKVDEDIRLLQIFNELGCVYREYCSLYNQAGKEQEARHTERKAREYFSKIISNSENQEKYPIVFIDTYHDLAQTLYVISDRTGSDVDIDKELKNSLNDAENIVPEYYRFPTILNQFKLPIEECFEDYWQNLGKIYTLRGDLEFRGISTLIGLGDTVQLRRKKLSDTFKFYVLAAGYFSRYLERPILPENTFYPKEVQRLENHFHFALNLYERLSTLSVKEVSFVRDKVCKQVIDEYNLNPLWIDRFFKQPFDLLLRKLEASP